MGNAAMFDLLLPEDVATAHAMDVQVAGTAAMKADDHPEWAVVPYVALPPPEVESLPRGIPVDGAILSGFSGQSPVALGHQPDEMPRLRLVAQVTLAVRHFMAFELIETIERELQRDPTGASAIVQIVVDLMLIMSSG